LLFEKITIRLILKLFETLLSGLFQTSDPFRKSIQYANNSLIYHVNNFFSPSLDDLVSSFLGVRHLGRRDE